jgi:anhydro-N-acetylmuramic acid kinase
MRAVGLMSGTSLDGIDVAVIETDGERVTQFGPSDTTPYDAAERDLLRRALADAAGLRDRTARPGVLAAAERMVTERHAVAVEALLATHRIARATLDVVGFHGQTVLHRPHAGLTVQIGDGEALADRLGLPVVYDFRAADVAAGGQGAPLVPIYHAALAATIAQPRPLVVLNVGGVANITYIAGSGDPIACDTGPGNALIDDFMRARTGQSCDEDGATAARGRVHDAVIERVLADPFFAAPPPKSLDRNAFAGVADGVAALSVADGAATLTALTAAAVARIVPHLPAPPATVIVAGGGARNGTLLAMLAERLAPARVETAGAVGWSADALEAQAFAYLAARRLRGLPITFPGTTGVPRATIGGALAMPKQMRKQETG